ncbi:MAG: DegT/DnrJ/EryC1/StrS family aminotransferase [Planctomycetes bacterium]|nr:DegT/DnrJ/EryC1/StrS family aminotransferase [Planctomycetota bacterium]
MGESNGFSRRRFVAASSGLLVASGLSGAAFGRSDEPPRLALQGGPKAVPASPGKLVRWGEPEREQLSAMLAQDSLFYWKGPRTGLLIERFRECCPARHIMTCSSGTAALHMAVAASGIGPGDEVITSPISDIGTVIGIIYQQAVPVFADLVADTYNLDPADVERKITPKTKAILPVHLCGNPCDMESLRALADRRGLIVIEDCAQAWGARYGDRPIGTIGHAACFSLQNSKHITCGDGGIVASSDDRVGPKLQAFGDKGMDRLGKDGLFHAFATNYRMSEPQAAVAAAQLARLEGIASARSRLGNLLTERIRDVPGVVPHGVRAEDRCVYWFYLLRVRPDRLRCDRAEFVKALAAEGAPASAGYIPVPLYGNPVFRQHAFFAGRWPIKELGLTTMDYAQVRCAEAESILATGIRITIHEGMDEAYVAGIADAVRKVAAHFAS